MRLMATFEGAQAVNKSVDSTSYLVQQINRRGEVIAQYSGTERSAHGDGRRASFGGRQHGRTNQGSNCGARPGARRRAADRARAGELFQAGRNTVREALQVLRAYGIVEMRPKSARS